MRKHNAKQALKRAGRGLAVLYRDPKPRHIGMLVAIKRKWLSIQSHLGTADVANPYGKALIAAKGFTAISWQ
ncbi:hypothetical protein RF55_22950 [Lasius niger]|uniref:Uncharacterized protein n=1 Tax=Lasius niger TaxID=67767 RepID=A0A0J7JW38_LASNI|nr:hypothetical protein RF55_22950 [Lasius niger]